jgi:NitT/TauT family transport system substrate-binding protein
VRQAGALVAVALLAAATVRPASADDTLTIVSGSFPTAFVEVLGDVAERAGFFKQQHLIVNEQFAGSAAVAVQAVGGGKGDIGAVGVEPLLQGYEHGVRMVAFLSRNPHLQQVLGVLDASPIRTLADFKGTTIGELTLGQSSEYYTNVMLAGAGLKKSDYAFVAIGSGAQAIQALESGKVAAAAFPEPELRLYEVTAHVKFRYFYQPILRDVSDSAYVASPETIATKGDQLRRFSRAIVEAAILVRENPDLAARYFVESSGVTVTPDAIARARRVLAVSQDMLPGSDPAGKRIGEMPLRAMELLAHFMYDNGITSELVPAQALVATQFIPYANDFDHNAFIAYVKTLR